MTFDFAAYALKEQELQHKTNELMIKMSKPQLVSAVSSTREILQCMGFDKAKKHELLEPYKDAWGVSFMRSQNAWNKWETTYPNSEYFKP